MERVVAETVQLVQHALIDRVVPVDLEQLLHDRRDAVHIIGVERDDTPTEDISNIAQGSVFVAFELEFASERLFGLDTRIDGRHEDAVLGQRLTQQSRYLYQHALQYRFRFPVLLQDHLAMQIHTYSMVNRLMKPVIMNTWRISALILRTITLLP